MSRCNSCQAIIVWAQTEARDDKPARRIPLDAEAMGGWDAPSKFDDGNLVIVGSVQGKFGPTPVVRYVKAGPGKNRSHFASCPNRDQHRKPR